MHVSMHAYVLSCAHVRASMRAHVCVCARYYDGHSSPAACRVGRVGASSAPEPHTHKPHTQASRVTPQSHQPERRRKSPKAAVQSTTYRRLGSVVGGTLVRKCPVLCVCVRVRVQLAGQIQPPHTTSHHITPHHTTSHHITPHHITPHHTTSHHMTCFEFFV